MATEVLVPQFSATMEEATIVAWHKEEGDSITAGEVILEIETDKSVLEIEASVGGCLGPPAALKGATLPVGARIVTIFAPGESAAETQAESTGDPGSVDTRHAGSDDRDRTVASELTPAHGVRLRASPLARRLAREHGIDLHAVKGSGPFGRVTGADVERARETTSVADVTASDTDGSVEVTARLKRRRIMAEQVVRSRRTIPSYSSERWIDLEGVLSDLEKYGKERTETDYFLWAMILAIKALPSFRRVWDESRQLQVELLGIHIGLIVRIEHGLIIPTLGDLEEVSFPRLVVDRREAVAAARAGRLEHRHAAKAAISLSSLLKGGADRFEAIISPGQTAILALGRLHERVTATAGEIHTRRGCIATLSVDHRVVDGFEASQFLESIAVTLLGPNTEQST